MDMRVKAPEVQEFLALAGLPIGTSREYAEEEVKYLGLDAIVGSFKTIRFHIKMTGPEYGSVTMITSWLMAGESTRSLEYASLFGRPQRLPDGRTLTIVPDGSRGMLEFDICIAGISPR